MTDPVAKPGRSPVRGGELISVVCGLLLLAVMFGLEWFGVAGVPGGSATRAATTSAVDAWHAMTVLRWLMLLTILVAAGSVILHASQRSHGRETETGIAIAALGSLTAVLLTWRILIELPQPQRIIDQKIGAMIGLVSAIGIALGGYERLREERRHARRSEQKSRSGAAVAGDVGGR
jgi:cytochrome b561